jgi:hypothetical protein
MFLWRPVNLNTEVRKILNGGNLTLMLLTWDHWDRMLNEGNLNSKNIQLSFTVHGAKCTVLLSSHRLYGGNTFFFLQGKRVTKQHYFWPTFLLFFTFHTDNRMIYWLICDHSSRTLFSLFVITEFLILNKQYWCCEEKGIGWRQL